MTQLFESWNLQQRRNVAGLKTFALVLGLMLALAGTSVQADIINVAAKGSGWCSSDAQYLSNDCADSNLNLHSNTFAGTNSGVGGDTHRNWFAFDLPAWGMISSASMFVWNDAANFNTVNSAAVFNLYEALNLSFAGLTNGPSLGSVLVDTANAGTTSGYVEIELNAAGIAALTASLGNQFIFGGNNDNGEQIFGYTSGRPIAYLAVEVSVPATIPLLSLALAALGFRRHKRLSNFTFSTHCSVRHKIKS